MNISERTEFWKKLCSLSANYIEDDSKALQTLIKYPRYLYRYRAVTEQSIGALVENKLYFSRADYYDDPFDTLVKIDFGTVAEKIKEVFVGNELQNACDTIKECYGGNSKEYDFVKSLFNNVNQEKAICLIKEYLKLEIRPLLQKQTWSTCFSESGWNETMWLKYADRYYGFCLVYDLEDEKRRICGKKEKCEKCVVNKAGISLYPMYYSDDGYDATEYVSYLAVANLVQSNFSPEIASGIVEKLPPNVLAKRKNIINQSKMP